MMTSAGPRGRLLAAALLIACGLTGPRALAQVTTPGFETIPRPPGSIGPATTPSLMPPGSQSGVLAPQAPANPMVLTPPPAQPVALPPPAAPAPPPVQAPAVVTPTVPMVPAGQVALMVSARFGREPAPITGGLDWRIYPDKPDSTGVFRLLREERAAAPI